ncbi:MAG: IS481 family transposase [Geminicoccaceae bacterium]
MNVHKNALHTPKGREAMVRKFTDHGWPKSKIARQFAVTVKTVTKWINRFQTDGVAGLQDRSSRPHSMPNQTPDATRDQVEALRRRRYTQGHIARELGLSQTTVSRICKARGLSLLSALEQQAPRPRYERATPGEIIHIDIKKLGRFSRPGHRITGDRKGQSATRGVGWEYVHVAIDDHSRVAFTEIHKDEKKASAIDHLKAAVAYYAALGVTVTRVMTDNGSCYRSFAFRDACKALSIKHIRTRPYTPQTNGKAERFIQTVIREWAYATEFETSEQRKADLPRWQHRYNWHRPHSSLNKKPPISRIGLTGNNLLRIHI